MTTKAELSGNVETNVKYIYNAIVEFDVLPRLTKAQNKELLILSMQMAQIIMPMCDKIEEGK